MAKKCLQTGCKTRPHFGIPNSSAVYAKNTKIRRS